MAKQIIILDSNEKGRMRAAFWLTVPASRQPFYANASAASAYKDATTLENTAIQTGSIKEEIGTFVVGGMTNAQIRTMLQTELATRQAAVNAWNPWVRFGTFFDGTTWTNGGVA